MPRYTLLEGKRGVSLEKLIEFYIETTRPYSALGFILYPDQTEGFKCILSEEGASFDWVDEYGTIPSDSPITFFAVSTLKESQEKRTEFLKWELSKGEAENIGLLSLVLTGEKESHIPMIDFRCPITQSNQRRVVDFLFGLGEKSGFLLESGRSYHYYGDKLLGAEEWKEFTEGLKQSELIGTTWPKLQLKNQFSFLRITTSKAKPTLPKLIAIIGDKVVL